MQRHNEGTGARRQETETETEESAQKIKQEAQPDRLLKVRM